MRSIEGMTRFLSKPVCKAVLCGLIAVALFLGSN
jgi:hypothetical protein